MEGTFAMEGHGGSAADEPVPMPNVTDPFAKVIFSAKREVAAPVDATVLSACWLLPVLLYVLADCLSRRRKRIVQAAEDVRVQPMQQRDKQIEQELRDLTVMCAALEHSLPHLPGSKAIAGGLGKVMDVIARHHPSDVYMVHPMIKHSQHGSYGSKSVTEAPLRLLVDGVHETVEVYRQSSWPQGPDGSRVEFLLLSHPMFEARTKDSIYPNPMSRRAVLAFFSLWNQAVGALLARYKPDIFHCPDFHSAMAPWYARPRCPRLRLLLVLHNAEYQGSISTDMVDAARLRDLATVWNLPEEMVRKHLIHDGRFNMLKAAVSFILEHQKGIGCCAVSQYYAAECHCAYSILWRLPVVEGLDNPMLESERAQLEQSLEDTKAVAKRDVQKQFGLHQDPEARLFVSLGRLVRQKGVDLLADVAPWLLSTFPTAQLVVIGPVGDGHGCYASSRLTALAEDPDFAGRLFIRCEFMQVPDGLKFAADFCLMPSRDEPFGYVDIEFAWRGAALVGAQAGGLGKVPGFYYIAQNRDRPQRLVEEIRNVVAQAMAASSEQLRSMSEAAVSCQFPLEEWQQKLLQLYAQLLKSPTQQKAPGWLRSLCSSTSTGTGAKKEPPLQTEVEMVQLRALDRQPSPDEPPEPRAAAAAQADADGGSPRRRSLGQPVETESGTFRPYDTGRRGSRMPRPTWLGGALETGAAAAAVEPPPSAVQTSMIAQGSFPGCREASLRPEFFTQELSEEQIAARVREKLRRGAGSIEEIVEEIGSDRDLERAESEVHRWLLRKTLGVKRVHWCVSCGYVASPVATFLTMVIATEWGLRGAFDLPAWITESATFHRITGDANSKSAGIEPPLMNIILFSASSLASAIGCPIWARLSRHVEPRKLLACCFWLQVPLVFALLPARVSMFTGLGIVFVQGIIASCSLLFIVLNFMMSIRGDASRAALRMGVLEMLRSCLTWIFTGYVFVRSPSSIRGSPGEPLPVGITWILLPVALFVLCTAAIPGTLVCAAPGPYRYDRSPGSDFGLLGKRVSFLLLSLSDCLGGLASFPGSCYIAWWLADGWTSDEIGKLSGVFGLALAAGAGVWAFLLSRSLRRGYGVLIGTALLLAPPALLRAFVQEEVSTFTSLGASDAAMAVCVASLLLEAVRASAIWTVKIRVVSSTWRLLTFGTLFNTISSALAAASPFFCEYVARQHNSTFITSNQKELADAIFVCLVPLGLMQYAAQVLTLPFIHRDLAIGVQAERGSSGRFGKWVRRSAPAIALLTGSVLAISMSVVFWRLTQQSLPFEPVRRCSNARLPSCYVLLDVRDAVEAVQGQGFGLNKYGQYTTARWNCLQRMRVTIKGNVFVYWPGEGRCQVQQCDRRHRAEQLAERDGPQRQGVEVWSRHCSLKGQDLVAVQLFEWRWPDVARECEEYLGPVGFDMVQISPPQEHVAGDKWFDRYQPTSHRLESRSGTRAEFIDMVQRCRSSGVSVMADVVLNHMSSNHIHTPDRLSGRTCGESSNESEPLVPCRAFNHTPFSNRHFGQGPDALGPGHFHHYAENNRSNCGAPPWTNNRYLCDLYGLPDLDTESLEVQQRLVEYLMDLFEIGVTMIRVDAAAHVYASSLAKILEPIPWDYIVQEMYPALLQAEYRTKRSALTISPLTEMMYGSRLAQSFFDSWDKKKMAWESQAPAFAKLAHFEADMGSCHFGICDTPYPEEEALIFLDNHDQQRQRWKKAKPAEEEEEAKVPGYKRATCYWDGRDVGDCRPIYRHGLQYLQATLYMLGYPYGDGVRIMSSFHYTDASHAAPGVRADSLYDRPLRVHTAEAKGSAGSSGGSVTMPARCRRTPTTTPVTEEYDNDTAKPWVCEHRWRGVAGLVHFRRLLRVKYKHRHTSSITSRWTKEPGRVAIGLGRVGFLAMDKGWNWFTKVGSTEAWDLRGVPTSLPGGSYCDLAQVGGPVPSASWRCTDDMVVVGTNGTILSGIVSSGGFLALLVDYSTPASQAIEG